MSPGKTEVKQNKFVEFISQGKGYFRETYNMQHDHVLKKLNFDLLTSSPGRGRGGVVGESAGKTFATMLLH